MQAVLAELDRLAIPYKGKHATSFGYLVVRGSASPTSLAMEFAYLSLASRSGPREFLPGWHRDSAGEVIANGLDPSEYAESIGRKNELWTYLKSPYYTPTPTGSIGLDPWRA